MSACRTIHESITDALANSNDYWEGSPFQDISRLSADERGRWGEDLLHRLLNEAGVDNTWNGDTNTLHEDGVYDLLLENGSRIEVKTSLSSYLWQHENIYASHCWDYIAFVDVLYDSIAFTICSYDNMSCSLAPQIKHPVFGRKATLRGAQTDKYKLNFSPIQHKRGVEAGLTFVYDLGDPQESLYEWFRGAVDLLI